MLKKIVVKKDSSMNFILGKKIKSVSFLLLRHF